jgi:OFA family oxalate/formate antiporter-like MFS transporter
MLIGWSLGGIIGPLIASALIGDNGNYTAAYTVMGVIALVSVGLTVITKLPAGRGGATGGTTGDVAAQPRPAGAGH